VGRLIDFLLSNYILLILLGGWLLSRLGELAAKAARRAQEQQQQQQRRAEQQQRAERDVQARAGGQAAGAAPAKSAPPRARPRLPEEIAAEIRRMIELREDRPPAPAEPRPRPTAAPVPSPAPPTALPLVIIEDRGHGPRPMASPILAVSPAVASQHHARRAAPRRRGRRLLDLSSPAALIVGIEVLGPPRAMRSFDWPDQKQR
jgi:hypothetical protein